MPAGVLYPSIYSIIPRALPSGLCNITSCISDKAQERHVLIQIFEAHVFLRLALYKPFAEIMFTDHQKPVCDETTTNICKVNIRRPRLILKIHEN